MFDEAKSHFGDKFRFEEMPCEPYYFYIYANAEEIDTTVVSELHEVIYDSITDVGWPVIWVHDLDGRYLFSHHYSGKIYVQTGD
jgi:hypothetical protein